MNEPTEGEIGKKVADLAGWEQWRFERFRAEDMEYVRRQLAISMIREDMSIRHLKQLARRVIGDEYIAGRMSSHRNYWDAPTAIQCIEKALEYSTPPEEKPKWDQKHSLSPCEIKYAPYEAHNPYYIRENLDAYEALRDLSNTVLRIAASLPYDGTAHQELFEVAQCIQCEGSRMLERNSAFRFTPRKEIE